MCNGYILTVKEKPTNNEYEETTYEVKKQKKFESRREACYSVTTFLMIGLPMYHEADWRYHLLSFLNELGAKERLSKTYSKKVEYEWASYTFEISFQ